MKTIVWVGLVSLFSSVAWAASEPLEMLPLGSVTAEGWLREQLQLSCDGMGGHIVDLEPQMFQTPYTERTAYSGWGRNAPGWGAELSGNCWAGLVGLAWTLGDEGLKQRAKKWVEAVIAKAEPDGYLGTYRPTDNRFEDYNACGNSFGYMALLGYWEATGDRRVLDAVHRALLWFCRNWAGDRKSRYGGPCLCTPMLVVYGATKDRRLLDFCLDYERFLEKKDLFLASVRAFASKDFEYNSNHAVAYVDRLMFPTLLFGATGEDFYVRAAERGCEKLRKAALHATGAPSGNDEYLCSPHVNGESEYCTFNCLVMSYARLACASGDTRWGDYMEETFFNAAQGARKKDERAVQYFSSPNMVYATDVSSHTHMDNNLYAPVHPTSCCSVNSVKILSEFVRALAQRTRTGDLALVGYAPCRIRHAGCEIVCETDYPFDGRLVYTVHAPKPAKFAIRPKRPYWCGKMDVAVNGVAGASLSREWRDGDRLTINLDLPVRVERFRDASGLEPLVIRRGPLNFSLPIGERWTNLGNGLRHVHNGFAVTPLPKGWAWWKVEPDYPGRPVPAYEEQGYRRELITWNVALDEKNMEIKVEETDAKGYVWANPRVRLHLTGYKAPFAFPPYPRKTTEYYQPVQTVTRPLPVTLVPYGCTALRITYFPRCNAAELRPDLSFEIP